MLYVVGEHSICSRVGVKVTFTKKRREGEPLPYGKRILYVVGVTSLATRVDVRYDVFCRRGDSRIARFILK